MDTTKYIERLKHLCWDCNYKEASEGTIISRAINFGGFYFVNEVINRYVKDKFLKVLKNKIGLNKQATNYWCLFYGIKKEQTKTFQTKVIWEPF